MIHKLLTLSHSQGCVCKIKSLTTILMKVLWQAPEYPTYAKLLVTINIYT